MLSATSGSLEAQTDPNPGPDTVEVEADDHSLWSLLVGGLQAFVDFVADAVMYVFCWIVTKVTLPMTYWGISTMTTTWASVINPLLAAAGVSDDVMYTANVFFPVSETFAAVVAFMSYALAITVVRWIIKLIPFIG